VKKISPECLLCWSITGSLSWYWRWYYTSLYAKC